MSKAEEYQNLVNTLKSKGSKILLHFNRDDREKKYEINTGAKTKDLRLFKISRLSDKGDSNKDLSQILQILENTPSAHRYVRSSIRKKRNNLYVDARGLQAILEYSNSDLTLKDNLTPDGLQQAKRMIRKLAEKEEQEQDDISQALRDHILNSDFYKKATNHQGPQNILRQIKRFLRTNRVFKKSDSTYRLIDPLDEESVIDSTQGDESAFFNLLLSSSGSYSFLNKRISAKLMPVYKYYKYRELYNPIHEAKSGPAVRIIIDGADDVAAGLASSKRTEGGNEDQGSPNGDAAGDNAGNETSYSPDSTLSAVQATLIYPIFAYYVWLGVKGLLDEHSDVKDELNKIKRKIGDKELTIEDINKSIADGTVTSDDVKFVSKYISSDTILQEKIQRQMFLKIKKLELEKELAATETEKNEAQKDLRYAKVGFGAMSLMFASVIMYDIKAIFNCAGGVNTFSHGSERPFFDMSWGGMSSPSSQFNDYGALSITASYLALAGQLAMAAYATKEFLTTNERIANLQSRIESVKSDKASTEKSKDFTIGFLQKAIKYERFKLLSKGSLALGQTTMAIFGPVFLSYPPVLLGVGVTLTIGAVITDYNAQKQQSKKLSFNDAITGNLHNNVNTHYQPLIESALQQLQKATIEAREERFQALKIAVERGLTVTTEKKGIFELIYFKISSSELIKEDSRSSRNKLVEEVKEILGGANVVSDENIRGWIDQVVRIEKEISTRDPAVVRAHTNVIETIKTRNEAMAESSKIQSLPLILNQILKRIISKKGYDPFNKDSVTEVIKSLKDHYNKNYHQKQLYDTLSHHQTLIANVITKRMSHLQGFKPAHNKELFLPTWFSITSEIEYGISQTNIEELTTRHAGNRIIGIQLQSIIDKKDFEEEVSEEVSLQPMQTLLKKLLEDKDLEYKVAQHIAQKSYEAAGGKNTYLKAKLPDVDLHDLKEPSMLIKKTGIVKRNGKSMPIFTISKDQIIELAQDNLAIIKAIFKFCKEDLKTKYRSEFFKHALDLLNEHGISFGDDAQEEDLDDDSLAKESLLREDISKGKLAPEYHFKDDSFKDNVYGAIANIIDNKDSSRDSGPEINNARRIIEKNLEEQTNVANPDQAYRGCGIKGTFNHNRNGDLVISIESVVNEENNRFQFKSREKISLKDLSITEIYINETECYQKVSELSPEQIAGAFHDSINDTYFKVQKRDGTEDEVKCPCDHKDIYVGDNCKSPTAVTKIATEGNKLEKFDIERHGINALVKNEDVKGLVQSLSSPSQRPRSLNQARGFSTAGIYRKDDGRSGP